MTFRADSNVGFVSGCVKSMMPKQQSRSAKAIIDTLLVSNGMPLFEPESNLIYIANSRIGTIWIAIVHWIGWCNEAVQ